MTTEHQKQIQHLYWRAGFGLSPDELKAKTSLTIEQTIDTLFQKAKEPSTLKNNLKPISHAYIKGLNGFQKNKFRKEGRKTMLQLNANWIEQMAAADANTLIEKMTLFWHGHFACTIKNPYQAVPQMNTIRQHALGNFRDMLIAISKDGAMIRFLNNQQNKKQKPNENYARELNELFTIGRGNYTENDVKEAARAFTGWSSYLTGEFRFKPHWHDNGQKTFMGKTGNWNGEDIIDIILSKKETARFITTKIYRFFVNDTVNTKDVEYLADVFYKSNYNIEKLMRTLFESKRFYAADNMGNKIKSPIEFIVGMTKTLNIKFQTPKAVVFLQKALGQQLFAPPNVAGWAGGKAWIDNATLMLRLNLVNYLFQTVPMNFKTKETFEALERNIAKRKIKAIVRPGKLVEAFKNGSEDEVFDNLGNYLLQPNVRLNKDLINPYTKQGNRGDYIKTLSIQLMSMPEYQLC